MKNLAKDYVRAQEARMLCNGELYKTMEGIDLLLCPSSPRAAYSYTEEDAYGPIPKNRDPWDSRFTVPMDFSGLQPSQCHAVLIRMASLYHVN